MNNNIFDDYISKERRNIQKERVNYGLAHLCAYQESLFLQMANRLRSESLDTVRDELLHSELGRDILARSQLTPDLKNLLDALNVIGHNEDGFIPGVLSEEEVKGMWRSTEFANILLTAAEKGYLGD